MPLDWATTQYNLGVALLAMGDRRNDLAMIKSAIGAFNIALPVAQSGSDTRLVDAILRAHDYTMRMLERRSDAGTQENGQELKGG